MKYFISIMSLVIAFGFSGCETFKTQYEPNEKLFMSTGNFNTEEYVWECFYFSTNRVNEVK